MNNNSLVTIKDNICLNRIKQELQKINGVTFVNAMKSNEVENYCEMLNEINKINFPVMFTEKFGNMYTSYIKCGYTNLGRNIKELRWLIPYYSGEKWWIELEIQNGFLGSFFDSYFQKGHSLLFLTYQILPKINI